jgi:hypothetical protein
MPLLLRRLFSCVNGVALHTLGWLDFNKQRCRFRASALLCRCFRDAVVNSNAPLMSPIRTNPPRQKSSTSIAIAILSKEDMRVLYRGKTYYRTGQARGFDGDGTNTIF